MARAAKVAAAAASQTTAVTNWDEEMAKQAEVAAAMEANTGGGNYFSLKGGILSLNDAPIPGNTMAVVIIDSILENVFYEGAYDANALTPPTCFAFGRDDTTLAPHKTVVEHDQAQNETCRGCPMNEFGTADKGKGKACGNRRRIAMIPAGQFDAQGRFTAFDDEDHFTSVSAAFMKLPPTSVKGYAAFVKQVAGTLRRPPHGIFTRVTLGPDPKTQIKVTFEPLSTIPNSLIPLMMKRNKDVATMIEQPYNLDVEEQAPAAPAKGGRGKAPPVSQRPEVKRGAKKY
jgi:hypothetical protein